MRPNLLAKRLTWLFAVFAAVRAGATDEIAATGHYEIAPAASWVEGIEAATPAAARGDGGYGVEYMLVDRQIRVGERVSTTYLRDVRRITGQAGVEPASRLSVTFDPEHDRLTLHGLTITRGSESIDKLPSARISLLRRESSMESGVYDGRVTFDVLLDDVRAGDVLDRSFTLEEHDHSFDGLFFGQYQTLFSAPVRRSRLRLLHPVKREIRRRDHGQDAAPREDERDGWRSLTWEWTDLPPLREESDTPAWHRVFPTIEFSEYADWGDVAAWALKMYEESAPASAEVSSKVEALTRGVSPESARIMRVLRFAQEEIRYTGLEIGAGAYRPGEPAAVLARRYGDCKDKALLVSAMLRAIGVSADPALVSASLQRGIEDSLASPAAFDHVVVRVRSGGSEYWLDPTVTAQGGTLASVEQADFGAALPIAPGTNGLVRMKTPVAHTPSIEVEEEFDLHAGLGKSGTLKVESRYFGAEADKIRRQLRGSTVDQVSRDYLNYYTRLFPHAALKEPVRWQDDLEKNLFRVSETYEIGEPFAEQPGGILHFDLHPYLVTPYAVAPATTVRSAPLALAYPIDVRHSIRVRLPQEWTIEPSDREISGPGFRYTSSIGYSERILSARYRFQTLAEVVAPGEFAEYLKKLDQVSGDLSYSLTYAGELGLPPPERLNLPIIALLALGGALGAWTARWMARYRPAVRSAPEVGAPRGIRGWLLLPAINVVLLPIAVLFVFRELTFVLAEQTWRALPGLLQVLIGAVVAGTAWLLVGALMLIYLMFRRRTSFPRLYVAATWIVLFWGMLVSGAAIAGGVSEREMMGMFGGVVRDLIGAVVWTSYMISSDRVRATFVEERALVGEPREPALGLDV